MFRITKAAKLNDTVFMCEIKVRPIAKVVEPGQFVTITVAPGQPQLPLPVADFNREKGTITLVLEARDEEREQLTRLQRGDGISDCEGPFGPSIRIGGAGKVALVGSGIGVAPLFTQLREYKGNGTYTISIIGFHARDRIFWQDRIAKHSDELYVSTDDGSYGIKGRPTAALRAVCDNTRDIDRVVAIGSLKMMRACANITRSHQIPTLVNLSGVFPDRIWRDGRMMIPGEAEQRFSFARGIEFDGHRLDFDTLIAFQKRLESDQELPSD